MDTDKRPRTDLEAKAAIQKAMDKIMLSPQEREARILAAMTAHGIKNWAALAVRMGNYQTSVKKTATCKKPGMPGLLAMSIALGVPVDYLILKEWEPKGE